MERTYHHLLIIYKIKHTDFCIMLLKIELAQISLSKLSNVSVYYLSITNHHLPQRGSLIKIVSQELPHLCALHVLHCVGSDWST